MNNDPKKASDFPGQNQLNDFERLQRERINYQEQRDIIARKDLEKSASLRHNDRINDVLKYDQMRALREELRANDQIEMEKLAFLGKTKYMPEIHASSAAMLIEAEKAYKSMRESFEIPKEFNEMRRSIQDAMSNSGFLSVLNDINRVKNEIMNSEMIDSIRTFKKSFSDAFENSEAKRIANEVQQLRREFTESNFFQSLKETQHVLTEISREPGFANAFQEAALSYKSKRFDFEIDNALELAKSQYAGTSDDVFAISALNEVKASLKSLTDISIHEPTSQNIQTFDSILTKAADVDFEKIRQQVDVINEDIRKLQEQFTVIANFIVSNRKSSVLSPVIIILLFILRDLILPQIHGITTTLYAPMVQKYFGSTDQSNDSLCKEVKQIIRILSNNPEYRYVSIDNLCLRANPRIRSMCILKLQKGTLVRAIGKNRNWIKIEYKSGDNIIQGWAFTRYVCQFR